MFREVMESGLLDCRGGRRRTAAQLALILLNPLRRLPE